MFLEIVQRCFILDIQGGKTRFEIRDSRFGTHLSNLTSRHSPLKSHLSNLTSRLSSLESRLSNLTSRLSSLESRLSNPAFSVPFSVRAFENETDLEIKQLALTLASVSLNYKNQI